MDIQSLTLETYCDLTQEEQRVVNAHVAELQRRIQHLFDLECYAEMLPLIVQLPEYIEPYKSQYYEEVVCLIQQASVLRHQQRVLDLLKGIVSK